MTVDRALDLLEQTLNGMAPAHKARLIHRDIKPANILLTERGEIRIADFGIAKAPDGQHSAVSQLGIGSRNYMAPEQRESTKHVDARADVYSLAVLTYQMLTGKLPTRRYADPNDHCAALGSALNRVILKARSVNKCGRFQDAAEFNAVLKSARLQQQQSDSDTQTYTDVSPATTSTISPRLQPLAQLIDRHC
ncbi:hypothetical protein A9Q89_03725 [Gammaproteobacteria bacterium 53_120_T64]|nr:hypothetical protein A9Q89_03725 [Gammaproteobacteria bacterium 53_120_T64]